MTSSYENMTADEATFCKMCKQLIPDDWDEFAALYSFPAAYKEGLTPEQAIKDCRDWLED